MHKTKFLLAAAAIAMVAQAQAVEPVSVSARYEEENKTPGLRIRGWEVRPSLELRGGYDDNANRSAANPEESSIVVLRGAIDARRQMGPAELAFDAGVGQGWYPDRPEEDVLTANARLRGATYAGNQLMLRGAISILRDADEIDSGDNGVFVAGVLDPYVGRPEFTRSALTLGADQDFGRFFWDASATGSLTDYEDQETVGGLVVSQGFRNGRVVDVGARFGYRISEGYGFFIRGEANRRRYDDASADNDGWKASGGVEFELSRLLTGEITAGWAEQSYAATGRSESAFTYGAGLTWFASPLLSLTLNAGRDFRAEQTIDALGVATTSPVLTDAVSMRAELEVLRPLLVFAQAGYAQNKSEDGVQDNNFTQLAVGSSYILNRYLRLNAQYGYSLAQTNNSGDIIRNAVSLGLIASY